MLFNSYEFLFVFLPVLLVLYHRVVPRSGQTALLTVASYVFYGWWDWRFCSLLLASTVVDFVAARRLAASDAERARRGWLLLSLVTNLGLLGFFKYAGFFARSVNAVAGGSALPVLDVVLPVGISFYTFQSLSYTIDVYRRQVAPVTRFVDFACYVSLFSQLVAGPIVRFTLFQPQLETRRTTPSRAVEGVHLFVVGLAKKVILADSVALVADACFDVARPGFDTAWVGAIAYTLQIYFDFSAYSDMAVGLGKLFGFELPQNFDSPYRSTSITDFWRRWHMSLSSWLRDYLYIPLGGNRHGPVRTYVNLMLTMLLGGLWHGANWTFVVWGAYHGGLLAIERKLGLGERAGPGATRLLRIAITFVLTVVGWVFFRCESLAQAGTVLHAMFGGRGLTLTGRADELSRYGLVMVPVGLAIVWLAPNTWQWRPRPTLRWAVPVSVLAVLAVGVCLSGSYSPFLYFQF